MLFIKGKVLEAMDNRGLASECYMQALQCDVHCFEAFDALIQHHMLNAAEGKLYFIYSKHYKKEVLVTI